MLLPLLLVACGEQGGPPAIDSRKDSGHLVEVLQVQPQSFSQTTEHTGSLRARRTTRLFNLEEGRITRLKVFEGDAVRQGQVLVELDDGLLRAELQKASAVRAQAELDLQRLQGLAERNIESQNQLEKARTQLAMAQGEENVLTTRLGYTRISAPFRGIVSQRLVQEGDVAAKHTHLLSVYDPTSLITEIRVSELLLPMLHEGDGVGVQVDALGDQVFSGSVTRIHPTIDDKTRRGVVEVEMKPVPAGVMAGQLCRVTIQTRHEQRLVIPFAALQRDLDSEYVFVVGADDKAELRRVSSGLRLQEQVEISKGLVAGDKVVVRGFFGLRAGTALAIGGGP